MKTLRELSGIILFLFLVASCGGGSGNGTDNSTSLEDPVADPVADPVSNPVSDPVADPVSDPVTDPVSDPVTTYPIASGWDTSALDRLLETEILRVKDYEEILSYSVRLFSGIEPLTFVKELKNLENSIRTDNSSFVEVDTTSFDLNPVANINRVVECPDGGRVFSSIVNLDSPPGSSHALADCAFNNRIYGKNYYVTETSDSTVPIVSLLYRTEAGIGYVGSGDFFSFGEVIVAYNPEDESDSGNASYYYNGEFIGRSEDGSRLTISHTNTSYTIGDISDLTQSIATSTGRHVRSFRIEVALRRPESHGVNLLITSPAPFVSDSLTEDFILGEMKVTISEGNANKIAEITMQIDNGDPSSFNLIMVDTSGNVDTSTITWVDKFRIKRPISFR